MAEIFKVLKLSPPSVVMFNYVLYSKTPAKTENNIKEIMPLQTTYFYKVFLTGFGMLTKKKKVKQKGCQTETASGFAPPVIYFAFFLS